MSQASTLPELNQRVLAKIKPASELERHIRCLFFGRSGSGKTRLAASAPKVLLVDINEKGTESTRRDLNPHVYLVEYWAELNDVFWYLQSGDHDYETVAIDGVTAMQNLCMKFVLGDEKSRDASRDPDMPTRQVWGKLGELMKTQITNFRNLPMNVIFTALQRSRVTGDSDEDMGESVISPACSPSVSGHLEAAVDIIGHLSTREVYVRRRDAPEDEKPKKVIRRQLLVGPSERYITKDRTGKLGMIVKSPTMPKIIQSIYSEEN